MRFLQIIFAFSLLAVHFPAFADDNDEEQDQEEETVRVQHDEEKVETSKTLRKKKYVYGTVGLGLTSLEGRVGLYLPYDTTLEYVSQIMVAPQAVVNGARVRKFFGNSFYVSLEAGVGKSYAPAYSDYYRSSLQYEMVGIGNEWIVWNHFVIGCEWIAIGKSHWHNVSPELSRTGRYEGGAARLLTLSVGLAI